MLQRRAFHTCKQAWQCNKYPTLGSTITLLSDEQKQLVIKLKPNQKHIALKEGAILVDDIFKTPYGGIVEAKTKTKSNFFVLQETSIVDVIAKAKRESTVIYPKDAAYLVHQLAIGEGTRIVECGTGKIANAFTEHLGSGHFTSVLAWRVGKTGHVYTFEQVDRHQQVAKQNIVDLGFQESVTFSSADISNGFGVNNVDVVFLDMREPHLFVQQAYDALRPNGHFGVLVPTTNQIQQLLAGTCVNTTTSDPHVNSDGHEFFVCKRQGGGDNDSAIQM